MLRFRSLVLLQSVLCVSGCAYSLNPLYTDDIVVGDPDLSGTWEIVHPPDGGNIRRFQTCVLEKFSKNAKGTYVLTSEWGDETEFVWRADLVKLDDNLYLELSPDETEVPDKLSKLVLPLYRVYRVDVDGDEVKVTLFSETEFVDAAREEGLEFVTPDPERAILTAKTSELQELYRKHGDRFFHKKPSFVYRRKQTTAEPE